MKLNILLGDLLSVRCDGWVIPAGGQLSRRIFRHGGDILTVEWEQPGWELQEGGTIITSGGDWPVRYLLHTAFPDSKEDTGDYAHLAKCCRSLLTKANNINSCRKDTMHHLAMPLPTGYSLGHSRYGTTMESLTAGTRRTTPCYGARRIGCSAEILTPGAGSVAPCSAGRRGMPWAIRWNFAMPPILKSAPTGWMPKPAPP